MAVTQNLLQARACWRTGFPLRSKPAANVGVGMTPFVNSY